MSAAPSPVLGPTGPVGGPGPVLRLEDVSVSYGRRPVVRDVSFELGPGRWLAIIGPNGAGKSTLLRALVGVVAHRGVIEIGGVGRRVRDTGVPRVAYVPQHPGRPDGMTTAEYVLLGRTAHLGLLRSESGADRRRVAEVLEQMGLSDQADREMAELSGGEAQRASLARALVQEASILVLDEPTSSLDLGHQLAALELIDRLRRELDLAVVTAMHDLTEAGRFADQLLLLADGRPVALGPPAEVLTEPVLSRYYRTPVSVLDGPDGTAVVVPRRHDPTEDAR
jgi:iron complex transport system ATP-binding protein